MERSLVPERRAEDPEWLLEHMGRFGSARCENHYNVPAGRGAGLSFKWMKQVASHFGGTRNGVAVSWPARIKAAGELRSQFQHVVDITPTLRRRGNRGSRPASTASSRCHWPDRACHTPSMILQPPIGIPLSTLRY